MASHDQFLSRPGEPGMMGALMDEYARAAADYCSAVEATEPGRWSEVLPGREPDTASLQGMCAHVVGASRRYSDYIRKRRGLAHVDKFVLAPDALPDRHAVRPQLAQALRYTEGALEGLERASEDEVMALTFPVRWGPVYDPEMLLEHAIVHLLRHRRMIERWPGSPR